MSSLKERARAVAKAAITEHDVRRDPVAAFYMALGAARGFVASAIEAGTAKTEGLGPKDESAVAKPDAQPPSGDPSQ